MFDWLKSFLSRISMLINYTMWSSNLFFFCIQLFPAFFYSTGFSFFRVLVFQSPCFSGSRFFWVQAFLGRGFSGSGSRVWVLVLEVAVVVSFLIFPFWMRFSTDEITWFTLASSVSCSLLFVEEYLWEEHFLKGFLDFWTTNWNLMFTLTNITFLGFSTILNDVSYT